MPFDDSFRSFRPDFVFASATETLKHKNTRKKTFGFINFILAGNINKQNILAAAHTWGMSGSAVIHFSAGASHGAVVEHYSLFVR